MERDLDRSDAHGLTVRRKSDRPETDHSGRDCERQLRAPGQVRGLKHRSGGGALCVKLIEVDNVEERALLRLSDKLGSTAGVFPDQHDAFG